MRLLLRIGALAVIVLVTASALFVFLTLPARGIRLDGISAGNVVAGAYHVHTTRSDGTKSVEEIASAAARAGLRRGDVITAVDGKAVGDVGHFRNLIAATPPGTRVRLTLMRDKQEQIMEVTVAEAPGKRVVTETCGGTMSGSWETGMRSIASAPASAVTIAMTIAKRGRSTKMAENTRLQPRAGVVCGAGGAAAGPGFTGWPGRTRCTPSTTTLSPPSRPDSITATSPVERPSRTFRRCATLPSPTTKT